MTLLAALNELTESLTEYQPFKNWLATYSVGRNKLSVLKTNRKVTEIPDSVFPCVILELPDGTYGERSTGGLLQAFSHEIDLIFAIRVNRDNFNLGFDSRIELIDQVLPSFMLNHHRLANYVSDMKILKFTTDSGLNFPKVFVQVTVSLSGNCKRD